MLSCKDVTWLEAKLVYSSAWSGLLLLADGNPTMLPEWIECAADAAGMLGQLRVFLAFEAGMIAGVIPYFLKLKRAAGIRFRSLELAGNLVAYHNDIVAADRRHEILEQFLDYRSDHGDWDSLFIGNTLIDGAAARTAARLATDRGYALVHYPGETSPYLRMTGTWDDLLSSKSKKFRNKVRRREKQLSSSPEIELRWTEDCDDTSALLADILEIERASWKASDSMDIPSRTVELRYHERVLPMMARKGLLYANVLYVRGEPAAYMLCYRWNGCVGHMKTSFKDAFADLSPGAMSLEATLRRAFADGCREFDFLGDEMDHKRWWSNGSRAHESLLLCNRNAKGRVLGWLKRSARRINALLNSGPRRLSSAPESAPE